MAFLRKKPEDPKVDLTPMVDVVFLLLIFFMISTTFIETPGISIKLPSSSAQASVQAPEEIKIYLAKNGEIFFKENTLSFNELTSLLMSYRGEAGKMTFLLLADQDARHGKVVQVMDLAREAGFGKLAIGTERKGEKP
ncbi:MAG: biopolymer transporter ExbD [Deltaproteobacteria bacterium]|nr:biopolymer transporter ExbD [Deltaproteobacteria bacterium]